MSNKITSLQELKSLKDEYSKNIDLRISTLDPKRTTVYINIKSNSSKEIGSIFLKEIRNKNLFNISVVYVDFLAQNTSQIVKISSFGKSDVEYHHVDADMAQKILNEHILNGKLLDNAIVSEVDSK